MKSKRDQISLVSVEIETKILFLLIFFYLNYKSNGWIETQETLALIARFYMHYSVRT